MIGIEAARRAVERGDWVGALDLVSGPGVERDVEALEVRAQAAYGAGELETAVGAWETVHGLRLAAGQHPEAAWAAGMVALYLMIDTGMMTPVRGWLARADRLVGDSTDAPALAVVAMVRTYERFMCGDPVGSRESAERAVRLGRELGVQPAVVIGQVAIARLRIADGEVEEGLAALDEVAALLMSGRSRSADHRDDVLRADLRGAVAGAARPSQGLDRRDGSLGPVVRRSARSSGRCRVHRAELLRVTGPCEEAEREALGACEELRPWMRREFGWPLVELGTIRLRKGDLAGAEEAFAEAHAHAWSPQPGLALLRLAQGDVASATTLIADAIEHPMDTPSKELPPFADLRLAPLLAAQAEIALRAEDPSTATMAADALADIADRYASPGLAAAAALARGQAVLASGDAATAIDCLAGAISAWADLGAPYEAASARLELGRAYSLHRQCGSRADGVAGSALGVPRIRRRGQGRAGGGAHALGQCADAAPGRRPRPPTSGESAVPACWVSGAGRWCCPISRGSATWSGCWPNRVESSTCCDLVAVEQGTLRTAGVGAGRLRAARSR